MKQKKRSENPKETGEKVDPRVASLRAFVAKYNVRVDKTKLRVNNGSILSPPYRVVEITDNHIKLSNGCKYGENCLTV